MKLQNFQPQVKYLDEPKIEVGDDILVPEVKLGWTLAGPLGKGTAQYEINLALIGDLDSIEKTKDMLQRMNSSTRGKGAGFLHVDFPGIPKLRIKFNILYTLEIEEECKNLRPSGVRSPSTDSSSEAKPRPHEHDLP